MLKKPVKRLQFKSAGYDAEQGVFEGYAAVFGNIDSEGDVIEPGAFKKTLESGAASGGVPILAQHEDMSEPLGKSLSLEEDDHGLKIKGYIAPTRKGEDYRQLLKDGVIDSMSIGYISLDDYRGDDGARHITEAEVLEVSLVNIPANDQARITDYKSKKQGGIPMPELQSMTTEDLAALAAAAQEELAMREDKSSDVEDEEQKSAGDANGDSSDVDEQTGTKAHVEPAAERKSHKNPPARSAKAADAAANIQRKYADIYLPTPAQTNTDEKLPPGIGFARSVKCLALAKGDPDRAASIATKNYGGDRKLSRELKALSVTSPTAGGFLVPEVYSSEIIPLLRAKTIVEQLGATSIGMPSGNLTIPKMSSGTAAHYVGELRTPKASEVKVGTIKLSAKKLMGKVVMSNDLLRANSYNADKIVLDDITRVMAETKDVAAFLGGGTDFTPLGILKNKEIAQSDIGEAGLSTLSNMYATLLKRNANMDKLGWALNPYGWQEFHNVANALGVYPLRDQMDSGKLMGYPFAISTNLPNKGDKTPVILGNWSDLLIGEQAGIEVETSREGVFGSMGSDKEIVSAFDVDATLLRVISLHDMAVRYPESFVVGYLTLSHSA